MNVTLSTNGLKDGLLKRIFAEIEKAFIQVKQYAVLPPGGTAGSVLVKADARNYNADWQSPADTAANIAAAAAAVNTTGKYAGRIIFDTTNNRLMVAAGSGPTATWWRADGALSVTPA